MCPETEDPPKAEPEPNSTGKIAIKGLSEEAPERRLDLELEDLEHKLEKTSESTPLLRKFLKTRIQQVKHEIAHASKGSQKEIRNTERPNRWVPPNRPLTLDDIKARREFKRAKESTSEATALPSDGTTPPTSAISESRISTAGARRAVLVEKGAITALPSYQVPIDEWNKWEFRFSYFAVAALALFWCGLGNRLQCISIAFPFVVSIVLGGLLSSLGPFGIFLPSTKRPRKLEDVFCRNEGVNTCKRHALESCRTCLGWQWNRYRSMAWASTAAFFFLLLGIFTLTSTSDGKVQAFQLGNLTYLAFGAHIGSGAFLFLRVYSEQQRMRPFVVDDGRPFAMSWGILKSSDVFVSAIQLIFFASWLVILYKSLVLFVSTRSLAVHSLDPLKLAITSFTLYYIAMFWLLKGEETLTELLIRQPGKA